MVWIDSGTTYTYSPTLTISSSERLQASGTQSGQVTSSTTINAKYVQQYLVNASYKLLQAPASYNFTAPTLNVVTDGSTSSITLSENATGYWIVSGSTWSVPDNESGTGYTRWLGYNTTGVVDSSEAIAPEYMPQFFVSMNQNAADAGSVEGGNGWYNANTSVSISALANPGWSFEEWTGQAGTFNQSSANIRVTSPLNETAVFYAALVINPASNGQIAYSYGSNSGTVAGGSTVTLFVSPGTNVTLSASSKSLFYSPGSWSVGNDSSTSPPTFVLSINSPTTVGISFDLNLTTFALIGAAVAAAIGSVIFLVIRRGPGRELTSGSAHTWKW
jgi:hypothetical protein